MIYLQKYLSDVKGYEVFKANEKGEVSIENIAKVWSTDVPTALEWLNNNPDFYVINTSDNGNKADKKDGK